MTALRATVNQKVQLGWEATAGTPVPANKLVEAWEVTLGSKVATKQFRATGRRHNTASELLTDMSTGKLKGVACYNSMGYLYGNLYGKATPVAHSPSTTAYDSIWTPPISGALAPSPWTIQQGDGNYGEQYAYALISGFAHEVSRKSEVTQSGDLFAQALTTGASLTASPSAIPVVPMVGGHFNLYLDGTSAGIGSTQIVNPIKFGPSASGYFNQFWPVNRSNASFGSHVDAAPKFEFKLLLEADTQGWSLRANLTAGTRCYVREQATGPVLDAGNSINYGYTHDFCLFVTNVSDLQDSDGVYAIEWTMELAEDTSWGSGQAHKITLTNAIQTY